LWLWGARFWRAAARARNIYKTAHNIHKMIVGENFDEIVLDEIYIVEHDYMHYPENDVGYLDPPKEYMKIKIQIIQITGYRNENNMKMTDYKVCILDETTKVAHLCEQKNMNDEIQYYKLVYRVKENRYNTVCELISMKMDTILQEQAMYKMKNAAAQN
jgi:hypothetical protein